MLQMAVSTPAEEPAGLSIRLRVAGPQANVLAFVHAVEAGQPAMRFVDWRVERDAPGFALSGSLFVPWNRVT